MDPTIHLGNVRAQRPRISRDTVLKPPHREKERVKRVTINRLICPHVMIFD